MKTASEILDHHLRDISCDREMDYIDDHGVYEPIEAAMTQFRNDLILEELEFLEGLRKQSTEAPMIIGKRITELKQLLQIEKQ